ncbi:MAG TPA: hypothetical protein VHK26_02265 [Methyloceanibacter sp.]|nr:hypothetical protein [Methyloceanibacter sp.]
MTAILANDLALGHDVLLMAGAGRSGGASLDAVVAVQELLVGCLVALLHDVIGAGKIHGQSACQAETAPG